MPSVAVICPVHIRLDETVYLLSERCRLVLVPASFTLTGSSTTKGCYSYKSQNDGTWHTSSNAAYQGHVYFGLGGTTHQMQSTENLGSEDKFRIKANCDVPANTTTSSNVSTTAFEPEIKIQHTTTTDWGQASCETGYQVIGGGCDATTGGKKMEMNAPISNGTGWGCGGHGTHKKIWAVCAKLSKKLTYVVKEGSMMKCGASCAPRRDLHQLLASPGNGYTRSIVVPFVLYGQ